MPTPGTLDNITRDDFGHDVEVQGWVEDVRNLGGIAFIILRQRSGTLQVTVINKENRELFRQLTELPRESVIRVAGTVKENPQVRNGWEVLPRGLTVLARAEAPLPLGVIDPVGAEIDTRLDNRFLDLRKPRVRAIFELEALLLDCIRHACVDSDFLEVHTPKIVASGAEGGATLFPVEYFGQRAYLAQSPQLYKQILMASGMDRVWEIAPAFRAELSDTVRHLAEFLSFDAEMTIASMEDVLRALEGIMGAAMATVADEGKKPLDILGVEVKVPRTPFPRLAYEDALGRLGRRHKVVKPGEDLDTEAEKLLGAAMAEEGHELYYITGYPTAIKPFYIMAREDQPESSHSFDLEYRGDEMASGGQREHRPDRLQGRMRSKGLDPRAFEFYLRAFRYGMPPHGGWGLGPERWVWKMLGLGSIREAVLFPRDRRRLTP